MLLADVNVYVYAHRVDSSRHQEYREWLQERLGESEPFGVSELALSGLIRVVTNRAIFAEPTRLSEALSFCDALRSAPASVPIRPGTRHWEIFSDLCRRSDAKANLVPDAYLAALALEHGATMVTADRGFHRYPGLRVLHPLDP